MATSPTPAPGGAPGGAPPAQGDGAGANPLQIVAGMTTLTKALAQAASPCTPECEQIMQLLQTCAQKMMAANPNPGGSGPAPY